LFYNDLRKIIHFSGDDVLGDMNMGERKKSKRKRGAPVGNLNALKHGRYTREARARKPTPIPRARFENIDAHITHIRDFMQHVFIVGMRSTDLDQSLRLLNTYTLASIALIRFLRLREKSLSTDFSAADLENALFSLSEIENGSH
jgi:hypothetical protein